MGLLLAPAVALAGGSAPLPAAAAPSAAWTIAGSAAEHTLSSAACASSTQCVAVGEAVEMSSDGGQTWSTGTFPAGTTALSGVACPDPALCVAVGDDAAYTSSDGGSTWTPTTLPSGAGDLAAVACPSPALCVAVGQSGPSGSAVVSIDGGGSWTLGSVPVPFGGLDSVSCPSVSSCQAGGGMATNAGTVPVVIDSSDGGATWSTESLPDLPFAGNQPVTAISCGSASACAAVGNYLALTTTDGGESWTVGTATMSYRAVACSSATQCLATGNFDTGYYPFATPSGVFQASGDGGQTWGQQATGYPLNGLACPGSGECVAVGNATEVRPVAETSGVIYATTDAGGPVVTTATLPDAVIGEPYSAALTVGGGVGPYQWAVGQPALPAGLDLDPATGTVSGTPTSVGSDSFGVTLTDDAGAAALPATVAIEVTEPPSQYTPLATPVRICDTRNSNPSQLAPPANACTGHRVSGTPLTVPVAGAYGVPADATAVVAYVTAVTPLAQGYLSVVPAGSTPTATSSVNFPAGQTSGNLVQVELGPDGAIEVGANVATDVTIDLDGYFAPPPDGTGLYQPLASPVRVCDTRPDNPSELSGAAAQCNGVNDGGHALVPGEPLEITLGNAFADFPGAGAAVVNLTVIDPTGTGHLTAWAVGPGSAPVTAAVNFATGQTTSTRAVVATGQSAFNVESSVAANLVVDVDGWYAPSAPGGLSYTPAAVPERICDTREADATGPATQCLQYCFSQVCGGMTFDGVWGGQSARTAAFDVVGDDGVPDDATAVVLEVTAIDPTTPTFLTVFGSAAMPSTSDLNVGVGQVRSNLVVVPVGSSGGETVYVNAGDMQGAVDLIGWFS